MIRNFLRFALAAAFAFRLTAEPKPVTLEVAARYTPPTPTAIYWNPKGSEFVYRKEKALLLFNCASGKTKTLATLADIEGKAKSSKGPGVFAWQNRRVAEARPQWSADGKRILIASGGDLFLLDAATGQWQQLTATPEPEEDAQFAPDGTLAGYRRGNDLYVQEIDGGKVRRLTTDGSETLWNGRLDWVYPEELSLSRAWWWSPDSRSIAYLQFDVSPEMIHPQVDATPIQAVSEPQRFPKAGTPNANVKLGVISRNGGKTKWMDIGPTAEALIARVQWMPGSRELAVQRLTRVQDGLTLLAADAQTGKVRTLLEERDKAWINIHDILYFFDDGRMLWASERDGFRHLYLYEPKVSDMRQLTSGQWEVVQLNAVNPTEGTILFTATKDSPLERHLYKLSLARGGLERMTKQKGTHTINAGPGGQWYVDSWQSHERPARESVHNNSGSETALLRDTPLPSEFDLRPAEYVTFNGKDGTVFHGQMIKPANFDPSRKYPAIVMVYGGPHVQTVRDSWAGTNWEQALAQRGYVIWRMDNRGSNFRGHAFEAAVHRRFGKQELADQLEGVEHLVKQGYVDPARIGLYGWSFGGYMTLYSMTHSPGTFAAGVAGAPVTDWRHYDTIYTERYMGLPARNEEGYKASSPVHSADKLEGRLLLVHNFQDDNVLFQNSQHMMAALQRADKQFEMMFYPQKSHGVTGPLKLHMLRTVTDFFDRNLKP